VHQTITENPQNYRKSAIKYISKKEKARWEPENPVFSYARQLETPENAETASP
jgi:hypothetical protein